MTKSEVISRIYGIVKHYEYNNLTKAVTAHLIAGVANEVAGQKHGVAPADVLRACSLVKKNHIITEDSTMRHKTWADIYTKHAPEIETIRQTLIDNKFTYLPLDAQVFILVQFEGYSYEEAATRLRISKYTAYHSFSNAVWKYFEKWGIPQPLPTREVKSA